MTLTAGADLDVSRLHVSCRYIYSLYWSITTLATVGYGDFTAENVPETVSKGTQHKHIAPKVLSATSWDGMLLRTTYCAHSTTCSLESFQEVLSAP